MIMCNVDGLLTILKGANLLVVVRAVAITLTAPATWEGEGSLQKQEKMRGKEK